MKANVTPPPRSGYYHGWNIVAACVLSQSAALGVTLNCFSLFLGLWKHQFGTPVSSFAFGVTLFSLGCAVVASPAGLAADKFPVRWLMGLGLAGVALIHLLIGFTTAGWQIIALYAVLLPVAVTFSSAIPAQTVVSRWFVRRRGLAMGLNAFGLAIAGVVFPPLITQLLPLVGWRGTWWLFAGIIGLLATPVVFFLLRDRPTLEEGAHYLMAEIETPVAPRVSVMQIFARPNFWAILGVFLPVQAISMMVSIDMTSVVLSRGLNLQTAGLLLSVYSISALTGKLSVGLLADRWGNRAPFMLVAALAAGGAALLGVAHGLPFFLAAAVMMGLSQGHWTLLASATAAEFGPGMFGRAYGVMSAFTPIGAIAPPIAAWLYEHTGDYRVSLLSLAGLAVAAGVSAFFLRQRPRPA